MICIFFGGGVGLLEYYFELLEGFYVNMFGFKVVICFNFDDVYWMLCQFIDSFDLVIFFELKCWYYICGYVVQILMLGLYQV